MTGTPIPWPKMQTAPASAQAGHGRIHLFTGQDDSSTTVQSTHPRASLRTCQATYPLKLLAPSPLPSQPDNVRMAYMLAYGGGLVSGDEVALSIEVERGGTLVLLTQGSTKVFKARLRMLAGGGPAQTGDAGALRMPEDAGSRKSQSLGQLRETSAPTSSNLDSVSSSQASRHEQPSRSLSATGPSRPTRQEASATTRQRLHAKLHPGSLLLVLPDPIQPFKGSSYIQSQRFVLPRPGSARRSVADGYKQGSAPDPPDGARINDLTSHTSTTQRPGDVGSADGAAALLVLDWFTSGRPLSRSKPPATVHDGTVTALGHDSKSGSGKNGQLEDEWTFDRYESRNEILLKPDSATDNGSADCMTIMHDRLVLENKDVLTASSGGSNEASLVSRMSPYSTYATLLIAGPLLTPLLHHLEDLSRRREETQFQAKQPKGLVWSFSRTDRDGEAGSAVGGGDALGRRTGPHGVLRVAAKETEACRDWLRERLESGGVKDLVGEGLWERCI